MTNTKEDNQRLVLFRIRVISIFSLASLMMSAGMCENVT